MSKSKVGSGAGALLLILGAGFMLSDSRWWKNTDGDRDDTFVMLRVLRARSGPVVNISYTTLTVQNSLRTKNAEWQVTLYEIAGHKVTVTATQNTDQKMKCEIWDDDGRLVDDDTRNSAGKVHCSFRVRS